MPATLKQFPRLNTPTLRQLPSGLAIVAEQMPVEAVNLSLWIATGSAIESDAINGMAHFLEHMVFKGTEKLCSGEFERRIEERGAVTNAATSQDYTHYYITTAPKDFTELAPLQIEVVLNSLIPDDAFERERLVILEEIRRSEDNPRRRTFQQAMQIAFAHLPYRRPVLGPIEVISELQPQQMRDFHTSWYQPSNMTAVAVGNLPVDELIQIVADGFTRIGTNSQVATITSPEAELPFKGVVRREVIDDSLQQARLVMVWRVPGLSQLHQTYALDVLAAILGQGRASRLVRDLRESGLVSQISVSNMTQKWQGTFCIMATLPTENLATVETAIADHLNSIQSIPVTEAELIRVRTQVANRFIFGNETPSDRSGLYGYYQSIVGDLEPAFNYPKLIHALEPVDLLEAAQLYLSSTAYGVVAVKPSMS